MVIPTTNARKSQQADLNKMVLVERIFFTAAFFHKKLITSSKEIDSLKSFPEQKKDPGLR